MNNINEEEKKIVDDIINLQNLINSSNKKKLIFNDIEFNIYITEENEKNIKREVFFELIPELKSINIQNINKLLNQYKINIDIYVQKVFLNSEPQKRNKIKLESNTKRKEKKKIDIQEEINENINIENNELINEISKENEVKKIELVNNGIIKEESIDKIEIKEKENRFNKTEIVSEKRTKEIQITKEEFEETLEYIPQQEYKKEELSLVINTTEKQSLLLELNEIFNPFVNKKTSIVIGVLSGLLFGSCFVYILHNLI